MRAGWSLVRAVAALHSCRLQVLVPVACSGTAPLLGSEGFVASSLTRLRRRLWPSLHGLEDEVLGICVALGIFSLPSSQTVDLFLKLFCR